MCETFLIKENTGSKAIRGRGVPIYWACHKSFVFTWIFALYRTLRAFGLTAEKKHRVGLLKASPMSETRRDDHSYLVDLQACDGRSDTPYTLHW